MPQTCLEFWISNSIKCLKIYLKYIKVKNFKIGVYKVRHLMIEYHLSSGSGGMADALDSGSSGSLSCESSSLFFRIGLKVEKSLCIKASPLFCFIEMYTPLFLTLIIINKEIHYRLLSSYIKYVFFFTTPYHSLMFIKSIITTCICK